MKEQIANEFMKKLLMYANNTESFLNKEIPVYIKEILEFNFYSAIIQIAYFILFLIATGLTIYLLRKKLKKDKYNWVEPTIEAFSYIISCLAFSLLLFFGSFNTLNKIEKLIKIKTAPRVFIIDYIKGKK